MRESLIRGGKRYEFLERREGYSIFEHAVPSKRDLKGNLTRRWNRTLIYALDQGGEIIVSNSPDMRNGVTFRGIPDSRRDLVSLLFEGREDIISREILKRLK